MFTIVSKVGEGTFSNVYLAKMNRMPDVLCALKHIIPTSGPGRVQNELKCLQIIGGNDNVIGVESTLRCNDSMVFVLPYFPHQKFQGWHYHGIIHVNSRFRRDVRSLEEEEEHWFDQEDENGDDGVMMEQTDLLSDYSVFKGRKSFVSEKPAPSIANSKRPLIGLVDYPDDEEDEDKDAVSSPAKRARLNAS